jgi:hypothetical protein
MFDQFHRIQKIAWGLFYQPPAYTIGMGSLSAREISVGTLLVPVGELYVRDIRVIDTLDVPFPPQREGFIIPAEVEDGLPVVQVASGGEVVALAGRGFLIFDPIIPTKRESLLVLSKALALAKNISTAAMLC